MTRAELFATLSLLTPFDIDLEKRRIGPDNDGAYIAVDLPTDRDVLAFGVGHTADFEHALAERGHRVFLFDHTIRRLPIDHPRFQLVRAGICGPGEETRRLRTLESHIAALPDLGERLILKMDVEGAEWPALSTVDPALLARFDLVLLELHHLGRLGDPAFHDQARAALALLTTQFTLFHVHANNAGGMTLVESMPVPDVLEVSFVRRERVTARPSRTLYPTTLDQANHGPWPDLPLFFYPFLPGDAQPAAMAETIARLEREVIADADWTARWEWLLAKPPPSTAVR